VGSGAVQPAGGGGEALHVTVCRDHWLFVHVIEPPNGLLGV
jgi:hypothetical protein